jgi:hypothetical protein
VDNEGTLGSTVIQSEGVQGMLYEVSHAFENDGKTKNIEMNNHYNANQLQIDLVSNVLMKRIDIYHV